MTGIAVHWHNESGAENLAASWPDDPRFELLIVDNGSDRELRVSQARILEPERNLGFAGAVNLGLRTARSELVLILNADITLEPGALESLLEGFRQHPEAVGLAPRLLDDCGRSQHRWQLRPLPSIPALMLQSLLIPAGSGSSREPDAESAVEQPAGAALALRRQVLEEIGGLDESFYPAWFEDVDLASRLRIAGHTILYWPRSRFQHDLGATIPKLGFERFLWIYHANLGRYLRKHHGDRWAGMARCLLVPGSLLRVLLLPIRKPRRAANRRTAAAGLASLMMGALSNWRCPDRHAAAISYSDRATGQSK